MATSNGIIEISVRDVFNVVFRHKWKIATFAIVVIVGVTCYTYLVPEVYRSEAKLFLRVGRESLQVDPTISGPSTTPIYTDRESQVKSELSILNSRSLVEQTVDSLGVDTFLFKPDEMAAAAGKERLRFVRRWVRGIKNGVDAILIQFDLVTKLSPREKAIKQVEKNLEVEMERKSSVVNIRYDAPGGEMAQHVLEVLLHHYLGHHITAHASQASPEFFEGQTDMLRKGLLELESELDAFKTGNKISTLEGQKKILLERISALEANVDDASAKTKAAEARIAVLESTLKGRSPTLELNRKTGNPNYASDKIKERLVDLRLDVADMSGRYPDTHPPLIDLRKSVALAEAELGRELDTLTEVTTGVDETYQTLQLTLTTERGQFEAQKAAYEVLAAELGLQRERLDVLASREIELKRLERDVDVADKEYRDYRDNLQRSRVSAALDIDEVSNVSIIEKATLPLGPFKPNKPLNIGLGILVGIFGGIFLAFAREHLDDSFNTKDKLERRLGVPVLTVVSEEEFKGCI